MIPIRVPHDAKPGYINERKFHLAPDHPLFSVACPVCDNILGLETTVLVLVGIEPEYRKESGYVIGGAVSVHTKCAGVPDGELL
jgi:hypothetical protein